MTEYIKPSLNKEDYDNLYEYRKQWLSAFEKDDDMEEYPTSISFFVKKSGNEVTGKVMEVYEENFDKVYDTNTVVRMITNTMFTKKLTKLKSGKKKRLTPTQKFINMPPWDEYTWVSLIEEVRYAVLNNIDTVLLSNKELKLLG